MTLRTGLIAQKLGMTRWITEEGECIPVTLLSVEDCQVVAHKTIEKDGYTALQLGIGKTKVKNISKALRGHFSKAKVEPKAKLIEFRISEKAFVETGLTLSVNHFQEKQFVDVTGISIGKGFAGVMKRHNFGGLRASHGVSISHRSHGSTGQRQDPGRTFPGKKMAGHMGHRRVTIQNLQVVHRNETQKLILIKGAIPGHKGSFVWIQDAVKKALPEGCPFPGAFLNKAEITVEN